MDRVSGRNDAMGQDPIKTEEGKTIRYFYAAKTTYGILFTACALVHSTVMAIVLIPGFAAAIPGIPNFESSTCSSVFGASVLPNRGDKTLMDSLLNFLQWEQYIASEAAIFWVANLVRNAGPNGWGSVKGGAIGFFAMMTFYAVIAGPTGAAIMGLWERDQIVVDTLIKEARDWAKDQKVEKSQ